MFFELVVSETHKKIIKSFMGENAVLIEDIEGKKAIVIDFAE